MSLPDSTDIRGTAPAKSDWNIYNTLLLIALVSILLSIILLAVEWSRYDSPAAGMAAPTAFRMGTPAASGTLAGPLHGSLPDGILPNSILPVG